MTKHGIRRFSALTAGLVCVSLLLGACGSTKDSGSASAPAASQAVSQAETPAPTPEEAAVSSAEVSSAVVSSSAEAASQTEEPTPVPTEEAKEEEVKEGGVPDLDLPMKELPESEGLAFVDAMKLGINLGNTFDAFDDGNLKDDMSTETAWVHDRTTEDYIKAVHAAGFETLRIPVSWHNHLAEDGTINPEWLKRVREVADWALADGMYVIINIHHDNHQEAKGIYPDEDHKDQSLAYIGNIWSQAAEYFRDCDDHLLFEAMNEPRLVGHENEWWINMGNADCTDAVKIINELNQKFVDTVRATGGNNASRYLLVPGYDASPDGVLNNLFTMPEDSASGRLILSVHAYTPYSFALESPGIDNFDCTKTASTSDIAIFMDKLYDKYTSAGIPVLITEFGAVNKQNPQDRIDYAAYYIARARTCGIRCVWWDNALFTGNGELFGLIRRNDGTIVETEIVEALTRYAE